MHYDHDCASWRSQGRPPGKNASANKTSDAYHKSYVTMLEEDDDSYNSYCATYNTLVDEATSTDILTTKVGEDMPSAFANCLSMQSESAEASWTSLLVNLADAKDDMDMPAEGVYEPTPAWERPAGHAVQGIDAFKVQCHINCFKEPATPVVGNSGAALTLISKGFLDRLQFSKPKPHAGRKLKLLQLTGSASCSEYVRLNLFFRSQIGPVCLKCVEAYVVKDMKADMFISEDTQRAWQLHIIHGKKGNYWQVGDSPHQIPAVIAPSPAESFSARWAPESKLEGETACPMCAKKQEASKGPWKVLVKDSLTIEPESVAMVNAIVRGVSSDEAMYLKAIPLNRGPNAFISALSGIVQADNAGCFRVKIANAAEQYISVKSGELLGHLLNAKESLESSANLSEAE